METSRNLKILATRNLKNLRNTTTSLADTSDRICSLPKARETQTESKKKRIEKTNTKSTKALTDMQPPTKLSVEVNEQFEYCVSRADLQHGGLEETLPNAFPPTRSGTQLEASNEMIVAIVVETADGATTMEAEKDTPLYRKKLQVAATRRKRKIKPIVSFVQKRDWKAIYLTDCTSRTIASY